MICCASWSGEFPVGTKPVVLPPGVTTVTMTVTIAATTASTPAVAAMMTFRRFPRRPARAGLL